MYLVYPYYFDKRTSIQDILGLCFAHELGHPNLASWCQLGWPRLVACRNLG